MFTCMGVVFCAWALTLLAHFMITKKEKEGLSVWANRQRLSLSLNVLFSFMLFFWCGLYLAMQVGKSLPTYQKKVSEIECAPDDMGRRFIIATHEPAFIAGKHYLIALPSNNGRLGNTKSVYQKNINTDSSTDSSLSQGL